MTNRPEYTLSNSRSRILNRLRQIHNKDKVASLPTSPLSKSVDAIAKKAEDLKHEFIARCEENRTEIHCTNNHNWPIVLKEIAKTKGLNNWLLGSNSPLSSQAEVSLTESQCQTYQYASSVEEIKDFLFDEIDASFTSAINGISETGTIIISPTPEEPRLMSLIPSVHVCLLKASDILSSLQVFVDTMSKPLPTNLLLISSPSKTADIQQTLAYGAHGPKELVVLLIED